MKLEKPKSAKYYEALEKIPDDLVPTFDELIDHYRFAADQFHGTSFVSPMVIAELVLMGWRNTEEYRKPKK